MEIRWQMLMMLLVATRTLAIIDLRRPREASILSARAPSEDVNLSPSEGNPTVIFEVTKPIELPNENPCSVQLLDNDFGYTYTRPPVTANYTPPTNCQKNWTIVVMEWKGTCDGTQYDRIAGVWLSGVEILRTCTAEPGGGPIEWTIQKDITKYSSLLDKPQILEVQLDNVIDDTFTGVYHVNITFNFYGDSGKNGLDDTGFADLILPISLPSSQIGGAWFQIENSSDVQSKSLQLPTNAYKAVLEIFASFNQHDEFWYSNPPNVYIKANNLTRAGNGPFREVVAFIDRVLVGAVWPFPVVYTGAIDPQLWQPLVGIGTFDLPSYEIEVTPFLGKLLDGKEHTFGFGVTNALDVWFIDANLHLWLDENSSSAITGQLIGHEEPELELSLVSNFNELDGTFHTFGNRRISSSGWVESSHGKLITNTSQEFQYDNLMTFQEFGLVQIVKQTIATNSKVIVEAATGIELSSEVDDFFPLYLVIDGPNGIVNISNARNQNVSVVASSGKFISSLNNTLDGREDNTIISTQEMYNYQSTQGCYSRNVNVINSAIVSDTANTSCGNTP